MIPLTLLDWQIVDAGDPDAHQTVPVELPIFIAVTAEPVAAIVAPFVGEAHGDTVLPKCPELLDQPVVELATPLARQERLNLSAALQKLDAIAPATIRRVSQRHPHVIARVPHVFRHAYLLRGRFRGERRKWRPIHFKFLYVRAKKDRDRSTPGSVSLRPASFRRRCSRALLANRDTPGWVASTRRCAVARSIPGRLTKAPPSGPRSISASTPKAPSCRSAEIAR